MHRALVSCLLLIAACRSSSKGPAGSAAPAETPAGTFDCSTLLTPADVEATCGGRATPDGPPVNGKSRCTELIKTHKGLDMLLMVDRGSNPRLFRDELDAWVSGASSRGDTEVAAVAGLGDAAHRMLGGDRAGPHIHHRVIKVVSGGWFIDLNVAGRHDFGCTYDQLEALARTVLSRLP